MAIEKTACVKLPLNISCVQTHTWLEAVELLHFTFLLSLLIPKACMLLLYEANVSF